MLNGSAHNMPEHSDGNWPSLFDEKYSPWRGVVYHNVQMIATGLPSASWKSDYFVIAQLMTRTEEQGQVTNGNQLVLTVTASFWDSLHDYGASQRPLLLRPLSLLQSPS